MNSSVSSLAIPLATILLLLNLLHSNANIVPQTCRKTPNYNLCYTTLSADPRSSTADVTGLALIMVDALKAKATETLGVINSLLKKNPSLQIPLTACAGNYKAILDADIPEAVEALQKGNPKFAEAGANDAAIEATSCEAKFQGKASPLTSLNQVVHDLSVVAAAIITLLL